MMELIPDLPDHVVGIVVRLYGFAMPCPAKVFANHEIAEARQWIAVA